MIPFALRSPETGHALEPEGKLVLRDAKTGARWPVIDGIPYLRTGRTELVTEALALIDQGDSEGALCVLLVDQDDWWTGPPADPVRVRELVKRRAHASLREAVTKLGFGRVGDYFVHRWTDPTYLAGLTLLEAHWNKPLCAFELACGIGHYLRAMKAHGVKVAGADVVFAKLWLARHWVVDAETQLFCFDAGAPHWPIDGAPVDLALCNDAFYFLDDKPGILDHLRQTAGDEGWIAVSHIHNSDCPGFSAGKAVSAAEIEELFPDGLIYDDAELTRALAEGRAPNPRDAYAIKSCEAFSVVAGPGMRMAPRAVLDGITLPQPGTGLRLNPLYKPDGNGAYAIEWPSERYEAEYEKSVIYPHHSEGPRAVEWAGERDPVLTDRVRRREFVDLPERW